MGLSKEQINELRAIAVSKREFESGTQGFTDSARHIAINFRGGQGIMGTTAVLKPNLQALKDHRAGMLTADGWIIEAQQVTPQVDSLAGQHGFVGTDMWQTTVGESFIQLEMQRVFQKS